MVPLMDNMSEKPAEKFWTAEHREFALASPQSTADLTIAVMSTLSVACRYLMSGPNTSKSSSPTVSSS